MELPVLFWDFVMSKLLKLALWKRIIQQEL